VDSVNIAGKTGAALLISGALIINGFVIVTILRFVFKTSIPLHVYLILAIMVVGLILMLLSAVHDRIKNIKIEEIQQKY
jgi:asparagine N-glycosylation enzyme membrane subunit Stt3